MTPIDLPMAEDALKGERMDSAGIRFRRPSGEGAGAPGAVGEDSRESAEPQPPGYFCPPHREALSGRLPG
jgi:hypothetical protein